jgi:Mn2+/Fe2+ NRAMP family transporter
MFLEMHPPALMVISQAFQACILPAVAIPVLILMNKSDLMNENKAGFKENAGVFAVIIFSFITTYLAITELF